ncbi:hypothetical protein C2U48_00775 [Escherichia coli]|nr:hypothetical protein C2U48_00775 [Escherichia coli]KXL35961.1 hypothetical protein AXH10_20250 [Escherichia coli]
MMSLWDALRMNMMISYQELVRTFPKSLISFQYIFIFQENMVQLVDLARCVLIPSDFPAL